MKLKIVKCRKPKNYHSTKMHFPNSNFASEYINNSHNEFLLNRARQLEHPDLSKRKRKNLMFSKPNKYILTKVKNKYLLWEKLN